MTEETAAPRSPRTLLLLLAALVCAIGVRAPGVFWGDNFPGGFHGHHVDEWTAVVNAEVMLAPQKPPRWKPNPYPKGLAAHVAGPILAARAAGISLPTDDRTLIMAGRWVSVAYGGLSVLVFFFLARRLFGSDRVALLCAWLLTLGGLHVSQSHFWVADAPALFWMLLGVHLLLVDIDERDRRPLAFPLAAAAMGFAAGLKLFIFGIAPLVLLALLRPSRLLRLLSAAAFFIAAFVVVNLDWYTGPDILKTLQAGVASGVSVNSIEALRIYAIEGLACVGIPVALLLVLGLGATLATLPRAVGSPRGRLFSLVVAPLAGLQILAMATRLDPFPRHLLPLFPWIILLAGWALALVSTRFGPRVGGALVALVLLWQAALVLDGEKAYCKEPRNAAMSWLTKNVQNGATVYWPGYEGEFPRLALRNMKYPDDGKPDVIISEAYRVNHFLSGTGWRDSRPRDFRLVFDGISQPTLDAWQSLHDGTAGYQVAERLSENYLMPEFHLADRLLGNRSRNYLSEVLIFRRDPGR